jgi:hypothetical protein
MLHTMPWAYILSDALGVDVTHKKIVTTLLPRLHQLGTLRKKGMETGIIVGTGMAV